DRRAAPVAGGEPYPRRGRTGGPVHAAGPAGHGLAGRGVPARGGGPVPPGGGGTARGGRGSRGRPAGARAGPPYRPRHAGTVVGPRWAPVAALLAACAWPVLRVSQTPYSEPLALVLLAGGLCLLTDVLTAGRPGAGARAIHRQAFVAGLVLAGGELVRLDFGVDFALLVPVLGWWWLSRRPGVKPFLAGALVGGA